MSWFHACVMAGRCACLAPARSAHRQSPRQRRTSGRRIALAALIALTAWAHADAQPAATAYKAGEVLVKFRSGSGPAQRDAAITRMRGRRLRRFTRINVERIGVPAGMNVPQAMAQLAADPSVQAVQPNYRRRIIAPAPPDDPYWTGDSLWGLQKINMQAAWTNYGSGDGSVVIADIDSGVNYNHPDLAANMWRNPGEVPGNGIDDDGNGYIDDVYGIDAINNDTDPMDDNGHGTHVAGTIAGVGNNGIGVTGVNWNAKILACKFLGNDGSGFDSDAIECFNYIVALKSRGINIRVTNNSWGALRGGVVAAVLRDAIDAAGNAGIVNVFAAGNDGANLDVTPFDPASFASPSIISVAASTQTDSRANFSNFGVVAVDLAAPGVSIWSTFQGGYGLASGTSMAAPHVAGAAALLLANRPQLSVASVKSLMLSNVTPLAQWSTLVASGGRLDVYQMLQAAGQNQLPTVTVTSPTDGATFTSPAVITVQAQAADSDGSVTQVAFFANGSHIATDMSEPYAATWSSVPAGTYVLTVVATDSDGATTTSAAVSVTVNVPANQPPVVTLTSPSAGSVFTAPATIALAAQASDVDGAVTQVAFYANGSPIATDSTAPYTASWASVGVGTYVLTAVAVDSDGASTTSSGVSVTVSTTPPPGSTASYVGTDTTTQGNWKTVYGTQGYALANDATSLPAGASVTVNNPAAWTWAASTSDTRALQRATAAGRIAATWYAQVMTIDVNPGDAQPHRLSLYGLDWDLFARQQRIEVLDPVTDAVLDTRSFANYTAGQYWTWRITGAVRLRITRLAGNNAVVAAIFLDGENTSPPSATASFVRTDTTTKGSWKGVYGTQGYALAADGTSLPAGASVTPNGQSTWVWAASTTVPQALQKAAAADRLLATWYSTPSQTNASFTIDVNPGDALPHRVSFYGLDWDTTTRQQRMEVLDAATGAVLDSRVFSGFSGGHYWTWRITGAVRIRVTRLAGTNALVSAVFLDNADAPSGSTATYVGADTTTQGAWKGSYGSQGYVLAQDGTSVSSGMSVTLTGQSTWLWSASTSALPALQKAAGSDRLLATWYSTPSHTTASFTIDVNPGDAEPHRVSLYGVDWDTTTRQQQIDVLDPVTGGVLDSRVVSGFSGGHYWTWRITGPVRIRLTRLAGTNAIVSAVFIDGDGGAPGSSASYMGTDTTTRGTWKGVYGTSGYALAGDGTSLPPGGAVTMSGQSIWLWASSSSAPQALQRALNNTRFLATWYSTPSNAPGAFSIDVDPGDLQPHLISLYGVDWDTTTRQQRIDILNPVTNAVIDSRIVSSFSGGQYWTWRVTGPVRIRVTRLAGTNAVVSAVFLD